MPLYQYREFKPQIADDCFISPTSEIIGRVELGKKTNVWFGTVLRGDVHKIVVGENCNIQDLSMLHVTEEFPLILGDNITIGHNVVLHACTIGNNCLIGMGAIVLDGAEIGDYSLVAAGSVVTPGKFFPPKSLIKGSPARVQRELKDSELDLYGNHYKTYLKTASEYLDENLFKRLD
jgi:carbonic anhydrase/acetyltransferase-like protein (isoleucine patch superfamily)